MNVQKMKEAMDLLVEDLGGGLLASDIFNKNDGQSIVGVNPQPAASALFAQATNYLVKSLEGSGFPPLGRYWLIDLVDRKAVIILPLGEFIWGMLVDTQKAPVGLILNVTVPKIIGLYEEAITE
jgi:hypothetical protein